MEQSRFNRYRGFILVLLLAMIGISPRPDRTKSLLNSASGETLSQQIARDVQQALDTLENSTTLHDWQTSGFTPEDVMNNALALRRRSARRALCDALDKLSESDLSHFESALRSREATRSLKCAPHLLAKIQNYWVAQTADIDAARLSEAVGAADPASLARDEIRMDSSVREIDASALQNGTFALVFEGALDPMTTRQVLETLETRGVKATFLMPGVSASDNPELVRVMVRDGDTIGSQGSELRDFTTLDMDDAGESISEGTRAVSSAGQGPSLFFAFPGESSNDALDSLVRTQGLHVIRGDLQLQDWKIFDPEDLVKVARDLIRHGGKGILIMHSDLHQTAIALPAILDNLAADHEKTVTFRVR